MNKELNKKNLKVGQKVLVWKNGRPSHYTTIVSQNHLNNFKKNK